MVRAKELRLTWFINFKEFGTAFCILKPKSKIIAKKKFILISTKITYFYISLRIFVHKKNNLFFVVCIDRCDSKKKLLFSFDILHCFYYVVCNNFFFVIIYARENVVFVVKKKTRVTSFTLNLAYTNFQLYAVKSTMHL